MTRRTGYADDIAVLVAEVTEPQGPLHLDLPADGAAVPRVLDALASWLESIRVRELDHIVVQHAADELVTNIVEHAYASSRGPGRLTVDAELRPSGEVEIRFCDEGSWLPARRRARAGPRPQHGARHGRPLDMRGSAGHRRHRAAPPVAARADAHRRDASGARDTCADEAFTLAC